MHFAHQTQNKEYSKWQNKQLIDLKKLAEMTSINFINHNEEKHVKN